MSRPPLRCTGCNRRYRRQTDWHVDFGDQHRKPRFLCPDCLTPEGNAEAAVNDATHELAIHQFATEQMTRFLNSRPPKSDA